MFKSPTLRFILIANLLVFLAWKFSGEENFFLMEKHFLVSWDALREGRWWTLWGSAFSHYMFFHFFLNMYVLLGFGRDVIFFIGAKKFLIFYFIAGGFSSFSHSYLSYTLLDNPSIPALGASGAVSGVVMLFSLIFPKRKILLLGLIPIPAILGVLVIALIDIWGLISQSKGGGLPIGHGAHLGGALTGFFYYLYIRKRFKN